MPTLAQSVVDLIHQHGPLDTDRLHALARQAGVTTAKKPDSVRSAARNAVGVAVLPDGSFVSTKRLLAGTVLTTRYRGDRSGVLYAGRDLQPFLEVLGAGLPLAGGGLVRRGETTGASLIGPEGWLPELAVGDLVALRWTGEALEVWRPDRVAADDSAQAQRVRDLIAEHAASPDRRDSWPPPPVRSAVLDAIIAVPALLAEPVPPLSELLPPPPHLQRPQDTWGEAWRHEPRGSSVTLPLPERVVEELERRADLIGERMPDYAAALLTVGVDRLAPVPGFLPYCPEPCRYRPEPDVLFDVGEVVAGPWGR